MCEHALLEQTLSRSSSALSTLAAPARRSHLRVSSPSVARKRRERSPSALRTACAPGLFTAIARCRSHLCTRFMHSAACSGVASVLLANVPARAPGAIAGQARSQKPLLCSLASPGAPPASPIALPRATSSHFPPSPHLRLLHQLSNSPGNPRPVSTEACSFQCVLAAVAVLVPDRLRRLAQGSPHAPSPLRLDSPVNHHRSFLLLRFLQLFSPLSNTATRPPLDDCASTP